MSSPLPCKIQDKVSSALSRLLRNLKRLQRTETDLLSLPLKSAVCFFGKSPGTSWGVFNKGLVGPNNHRQEIYSGFYSL